MEELLGKEWNKLIGGEFSKPYMAELSNFIVNERKTKKIYPKTTVEVLRIFNSLQPSDIKVVLIGQDPYHDGSADGYAFSSSTVKKIPPSLKNIFKEVETDIYNGLRLDQDPNLQRWVDQGVFLYNTALTVEEGKPGSHRQQWVIFTAKVLEELSKKEDIVWLLFGSHAKAYLDSGFIKSNNVITTVHPSPLSAARGWFGSRPFSKCNKMLSKLNKDIIIW